MTEPWTPGPWYLDGSFEDIIWDAERTTVVVRSEGIVTSADARLIAAAPEMAALLERITGYVDGEIWTGAIPAVVVESRALLARIRGEA